MRVSAIPRQKLTAEKLAEAISQAVNNQSMRAKAAEIGQKIRNEAGLSQALEIFNQLTAK